MKTMEEKLLTGEIAIEKCYTSLLAFLSLFGQYFSNKDHERSYREVYTHLETIFARVEESLLDENSSTNGDLRRIHVTFSDKLRRLPERLNNN